MSEILSTQLPKNLCLWFAFGCTGEGVSIVFSFCRHDSEMRPENRKELAKKKKTSNYCQTQIIKFCGNKYY